MSIIYIRKKENPYAHILKISLWDSKLSLEAVGLYCRLLSLPNDWQICVSHLSKTGNCSRDRIYRMLNELISEGYAYRFQTRSNGRFAKYDYIISGEKQTEDEFQKIITQQENPETAEIQCEGNKSRVDSKKCPHKQYEPFPEKPDTVNSTLLINDNKKEKISIYTYTYPKESCETADSGVSPPPTPKGEADSSLSPKKAKRSASPQALRLVDMIHDKIRAKNPLAILSKGDKLTRDRKVADELLLSLSASYDEALQKATEVIERAFEDEFWGDKIVSILYVKKHWNALSAPKTPRNSGEKRASKGDVEKNREQARKWDEHFSQAKQLKPTAFPGQSVAACADRLEIQTRQGHCVDLPYSLEHSIFVEKAISYLNRIIPPAQKRTETGSG